MHSTLGPPPPPPRPSFFSRSLGSWPGCFFFLINLFYYLFIYFWLRWVFVAVHGLSPVAVSWGLLFVVVRGLLVAVVSLVAEHWL